MMLYLVLKVLEMVVLIELAIVATLAVTELARDEDP